MQVKRVKRPVTGVLLLDKPYGFSSNGALQRVKHLYQAAKAGHTGNLDPMATGLLPVCLGEATKFSQYLLDADKRYLATVKLGQTTTTGDAEGEVTAVQPVAVTGLQVEQTVASFVGEISQVPPMHSALKHKGKALYEYARAGVDIPREARVVTIHRIQVLSFRDDEIEIDVECSKGTYVRVLAEDIGRSLGCGAHLTALRRTRTGGFDIGGAVTIERLEEMTMEGRDALLLPPDCLVSGLPAVDLDADSAFYFRRGQEVWKPRQTFSGEVRVYDEQHRFVGVGEITSEGRVAPKRLVATG